ncbi:MULTISPECIES: radical SAM family heme chaperone HemW [Prevotella]|nr:MULTISPECIES: radical SAM family heme chaperone HemW [Prevotella]MDN5554545.1 radical SAM family heme chaperone HemW [Prevotella sp.]
MAGLYIHIPFCASRCIYCGFYSTTKTNLQDRYVEALCKEMDLRRNELVLANEKINTIYIGGGTPSQLTIANITKIFRHINDVWGPRVDAEEVTIECNPDDITDEFAKAIASLPINRVSMGAQTFNDDRLKFLHRRHCSDEVKCAVSRLQKYGIKNISIDLMFGFPDETIDDWSSDIDEAISLGVQHISAYSLMYEEGTTLFKLLNQNKIKTIDEETSLEMYNMLIDRLSSAGYEQYEISNFAQPGFQSKHNSSYWHDIPYLGIGASAHSYDIKSRRWNISDITKYISSIESCTLPFEEEIIDKNTKYDDLITTAMRTREGIDTEKLKVDFDNDLYTYFMNEANKHIKNGTLKNVNGRISLTRKGLFVSDDIMSDLMHV